MGYRCQRNRKPRDHDRRSLFRLHGWRGFQLRRRDCRNIGLRPVRPAEIFSAANPAGYKPAGDTDCKSMFRQQRDRYFEPTTTFAAIGKPNSFPRAYCLIPFSSATRMTVHLRRGARFCANRTPSYFTSGRGSGMNPSKFGILTCGSVRSFSSKYSDTMPFIARTYAVTA